MPAQLLDAWGRPIDLARLKRPQAEPQGGIVSAGVRRSDALHPAAGLTPGRLARLLRESIDGDPERYLALAEDMEERDLHYAGVLGTRKRQVAGLEVTVEAAGDDALSVRAADLVREVIDRDTFTDEMVDVLDAVGKGFSCTEIVWEASEGQWRIRRLAWRDPRWFRFDDVSGEMPLLRELGGDAPLNPYGWLVHAAKAKSGLPIRGGLARAAAWSFLFKAFTAKDWAIFVEAYGQPLRLGKYGPEASDVDRDKLLEAVTAIGTDYAAIVPASMSVEFVKADVSGSHELYEKRCDWLDRQVSKLVLGQTATTDAIAGGHAVGRTHDGVRDDIEQADARQLAASLNRDVARPLVDFNMGRQKAYPRIRIGRPEEVDVKALVENVVKLVPLGLKVGMATMRDRLGLPDPDKDEELLGAPAKPEPDPRQPQPQPGSEPTSEPGKEQVAASAQLAPPARKTDAIDRAVEDMLADWEQLVAPAAAGLEAAIASAASLDEVEALLAEQFRGLDMAALTERLARAAFSARLAGEADQSLFEG